MGLLGDRSALPRLGDLVLDRCDCFLDPTHAFSLAALGCVAGDERTALLASFREHIDHLALTEGLAELLRIL